MKIGRAIANVLFAAIAIIKPLLAYVFLRIFSCDASLTLCCIARREWQDMHDPRVLWRQSSYIQTHT